MDLTLNDAQLLVLRWVADGADLTNPPNETFKASAVALQNRELVKVDKRRGRWSVEITDAGVFYLAHGRHPRTVDPASGSSRSQHVTPQKEHPGSKTSRRSNTAADTPRAKRPVKNETIPLPTGLRKPHRAVQEIIHHRTRLQVPKQQRERALLILLALADEAARRGWEVTAIPSEFETTPWTGRRVRVSPGRDLFSIDAGDAPAMIRIRMQQEKIVHVPTEHEQAEEARRRWRDYPKYDYVPTERMRLEVKPPSTTAFALVDATGSPIEDKLLRAVMKIERMSVEARDLAEHRRQRDIQRREDQRRAAEFRSRVAAYGSWVETLEQLRDKVLKHRELVAVVAGLREAAEGCDYSEERYGDLHRYLLWAEEHVEASDPLRRFLPPGGEQPDINFDEWLG